MNNNIRSKLLFVLVFLHTFNLVAITLAKDEHSSEHIDLESISVCAWRGGANACLNISFDDNLFKAKQISEILDLYEIKGSFFIISNHWNSIIDSLLIIHKNGHEIGSHTFSHLSLEAISNNPKQLRFELEKSQEMIENLFAERCFTIAEPYHARSNLSLAMIKEVYPFLRNNAFYPTDKDIQVTFEEDKIIPYDYFNQGKTLREIIAEGIEKSWFIRLFGHSINGEGYKPVPKEFLIDMLETINEFTTNNKLWVTSVYEGSLYQQLYEDIQMEKLLRNDSLSLKFTIDNRERYVEYDSLPISFQLPKYQDLKYEILTPINIEETKNSEYKIFTFDVFDTDSIELLIKKDFESYEDFYEVEKVRVYPIPATDYLYIDLKASDLISKAIYSVDGRLVVFDNSENKKITVSQLESGIYILDIKYNDSSTVKEYRTSIIIK